MIREAIKRAIGRAYAWWAGIPRVDTDRRHLLLGLSAGTAALLTPGAVEALTEKTYSISFGRRPDLTGQKIKVELRGYYAEENWLRDVYYSLGTHEIRPGEVLELHERMGEGQVFALRLAVFDCAAPAGVVLESFETPLVPNHLLGPMDLSVLQGYGPLPLIPGITGSSPRPCGLSFEPKVHTTQVGLRLRNTTDVAVTVQIGIVGDAVSPYALRRMWEKMLLAGALGIWGRSAPG